LRGARTDDFGPRDVYVRTRTHVHNCTSTCESSLQCVPSSFRKRCNGVWAGWSSGKYVLACAFQPWP